MPGLRRQGVRAGAGGGVMEEEEGLDRKLPAEAGRGQKARA